MERRPSLRAATLVVPVSEWRKSLRAATLVVPVSEWRTSLRAATLVVPVSEWRTIPSMQRLDEELNDATWSAAQTCGVIREIIHLHWQHILSRFLLKMVLDVNVICRIYKYYDIG